MSDPQSSTQSDASAPHTDSAPWWIREIRPYGITGLALIAVGYFAFMVYKDKDSLGREKDAVIQAQYARSQEVVQKNTEAFQGMGENLRKNNDALDSLNRNLENLNYRKNQ